MAEMSLIIVNLFRFYHLTFINYGPFSDIYR